MRKWLFQKMDRVVIHLASMVVHRADNPEADVARLSCELQTRTFVERPWPAAKLLFRNARDFTYESPIQSPWAVNNTVHGKLFKTRGRSESLVILAHGLGGELSYWSLFPILGKYMNAAAVDVAMIELPYHAQRRPKGKGARSNFITSDLNAMLEAVWQGIADFAALIGWARANGYQRISLWGFSLGSMVGGLVACGPNAPDVLTLAIPVAEMEEAIAGLKFCEPVRQSLAKYPIPLESLDLRANTPQVARENILVTDCAYDLFAPPGSVKRLVSAWHGCQVMPFTHSHISIFFSPFAMYAIADWNIARVKGEPA
ncbi:MAG TPA: alpha/beta hydrolase family protein [Methylomirabilota bacterium]|nr:alpha/beta hydrolase family protein [Methylomirabilota bacterium]